MDTNMKKTLFLLQIVSLLVSYDPVSVILMITVTHNGAQNKISQELPTASLDITRKVDTGSLTCAKILARVVYTNARQTD